MKLKYKYDVIILGSGDAGSEAAFMCAKAGLKVALVEAKKWGGSSLNSTNVPFGALFHASHTLKRAVMGAKLGLSSSNLRYNYPSLNNWKNFAMRRAKADSKADFEEAGITCYSGVGRFLSAHEISIGEEKIDAKRFIIATGASVLDTGIKIPNNVNYWVSDNVLEMIRPPKSIFIVGAGSTGCELAQYFSTLGTEVMIADIAGRLLPREDEEVGQVLDESFNKEGIKVLTQTRVVSLEKDGLKKKVVFMRGGQEKSIKVDEVLLCTGSAPNVDIGLENAGVIYDQNGISTTSDMRTSAKHIFAAGDVIGGHSSTDKAYIDARVAAAHVINNRSKAFADYNGLIRVTNTYPEIAATGITEDDCIKADRKYNKALLPLTVAPKSNTSNFYGGFVKIITTKSGKILGGTVMCPNAGIVIQELSLAIRYDMSVQELALAPHLTNDWCELIRSAAEELC